MFDIVTEMDIYLEAGCISDDCLELMTEATNSNFITDIMERVTNFIKMVKQKVIEIFTSKSTEGQLNKVKEEVKKNPSLKNKKVKIKDKKELDKLTSKVQNEIDRAATLEELKEVMGSYKRKRRKIIATSALAVVTVSTCCAIIYSKQKGKITELENSNNKLTSTVSRLKASLSKSRKSRDELQEKNEKLSKRMEYMKASKEKRKKMVKNYRKEKIETLGGVVGNDIAVTKAKVSAQSQVIIDMGKDVLDSSKEVVKAISNPEVNALTKVSSVSKSVGEVKGSVKSVVDGSAVNDITTSQIKEVVTRVKDKKNKLSKINDLIKTIKSPDKKRKLMSTKTKLEASIKKDVDLAYKLKGGK